MRAALSSAPPDRKGRPDLHLDPPEQRGLPAPRGLPGRPPRPQSKPSTPAATSSCLPGSRLFNSPGLAVAAAGRAGRTARRRTGLAVRPAAVVGARRFETPAGCSDSGQAIHSLSSSARGVSAAPAAQAPAMPPRAATLPLGRSRLPARLARTAPWGLPSRPTYGSVAAQVPKPCRADKPPMRPRR